MNRFQQRRLRKAPIRPRPDLGVKDPEVLLMDFLEEHQGAWQMYGDMHTFVVTANLPDGAMVDEFGMISGGWPTDQELHTQREKTVWIHA